MRPKTYDFRWGEGQISGFVSVTLGVLSVLAVLCYHFPDALTMPEIRAQYNAEVLRWVLLAAMITALGLGAVNVFIGRWRYLGLWGIAATALATVLGGVTIQADGQTDFSVLPIGLDWFILDLLVSAALFIPLERLWTLRKEQPILRGEWRLDAHYFAMTHILVSLIILASTGSVMRFFATFEGAAVRNFIRDLPVWVQFPLVVLVADLAQYTLHRAMHTFPWLWKIHAIHHSAPYMDWLASSRLHLFEVIMTRTAVFLPIFLLGFSEPVVLVYVVYIGLHGIFIHANVKWLFPGWRQVLVTPQFHHWHHSEDERARNTNYAVHYPWIDRLFGTHFSPKGEWPTSYGIGDERLPEDIIGQLAYPFVQSKSSA